MTTFIDRHEELAFLNSILTRQRPGPAQLLLIYGRRRVGKTALLRHWTAQSGLEFTYWAAEKEPAALQRQRLFGKLLGLSPQHSPIFSGWPDFWEAVAGLIKDRRYILVLDELPYAIDSDSATLSALQNAWDHSFKESNLILVLCGSHVRAMESILTQQSPLFGRMTGQIELPPLPYSCLREFFPAWSAAERVATYALVGGIPAYLEWLNPEMTLVDNIRHVILSLGSMFMAEPAFLMYEELTEPRTYLAILKAIGIGFHTYTEIASAAHVGKTNLTSYIHTLQQLRLVERRIPATVPPTKRATSRKGRYNLKDPYFRFYFRFLAQNQEAATYEPEQVLREIENGLQSFVGQTAFEELSREWVHRQGHGGHLPFVPDTVGSHWDANVQIDVVAINWQRRAILLGECTWSREPMSRDTASRLIDTKTPVVLADLPGDGRDWTVQHVFFARSGFTKGVREVAAVARAILVDLETLDRDLNAPVIKV